MSCEQQQCIGACDTVAASAKRTAFLLNERLNLLRDGLRLRGATAALRWEGEWDLRRKLSSLRAADFDLVALQEQSRSAQGITLRS